MVLVTDVNSEEILEARFWSYGDTIHYADPAKRFEAGDGGFAANWKLPIKKLILAPSGWTSSSSSFLGM
jgi:hypothetical protein